MSKEGTIDYFILVVACLTALQIPVATGVTLYEAHGLMTGKRVLSSKGRSQHQQSTLSVRQVLVYCLFGILAGLIGGLLGMGGGFIMGPLFLELGIPPQVHPASRSESVRLELWT